MNNYSPWIEKYRPKNLKDVVLDETNETILNNILSQKKFPNLLFYGPPGTGKTTTIINLIKSYQTKYNQMNKGCMIHLNASDDRGIEIIRNQIFQFVNTNMLFGKGLKFVVLDEVDYMTKNAQQALRYVIQKYSHNVRFCLICNYISRIDDSLQNEFIRLRFCQLPKKDILSFLNNIVEKENLNISKKQLDYIQNLYKSDIRSMINYIQINYNDFFKTNVEQILADELYEEIIKRVKKGNIVKIIDFINNIIIKYNISKINLIKNFLKYLINTKTYVMKEEWINVFKFIFHNDTSMDDDVLFYTIYKLTDLYKSL
jgi:replication factor C subunit 3/5